MTLDVAIVLAGAVAVWVSLVAGAFVLSVWLRLRAIEAARADQREQLETGAVARLTLKVEAVEETARKMRVEMQTFMANIRSR